MITRAEMLNELPGISTKLDETASVKYPEKKPELFSW